MANSKEAQPLRGILGTIMIVVGKAGRYWSRGDAWRQWVKRARVLVAAPTRGSFSLWAPWAFCAGVAAYFLPVQEPPAVFPVAVLVSCIALVIVIRHRANAHDVWLVFVLAMIGAFITGWGAAQWRTYSRAAPVLPVQGTVYKGQGLVLAVDKERGHRARYLIAPQRLGRLNARQIPKRIRLSSFGHDAEPGERVAFTAALQAPPAGRFPGAYNFARVAWFQRIGGTGFSYGHLKSLGPDTTQNNRFGLQLAKIRRSLALSIRGDVGGQKGAIAAALVTGDRSAISEETAEDLRIAGLAHMLAISGLHMGLVVGLVFSLSAMVLAAIPGIGRRYDARKPAAILGLGVATTYLLLSGASAPTERAFVMTAVVLGAVLFDRRALSLRTISLAALVVAAREPENVITPGFQMSFAAALALIAFYEWAGARVRILPQSLSTRPLYWLSRAVAILAALALTSLVAGLATGPFAAFYFHRTAVYGLVANIAAMPVFTFIVMPSLLAGTLFNVIGAGAPFFALAGWGLEIIMQIAHAIANFPGAVVRISAAPAPVLGLVAVGLLLVCLMRQWRRLWGVALIFTGLVFWSITPQPDGVMVYAGGALKIMVQGKEKVLGFGDFNRFELEQFASVLAIGPKDSIRLKKASTILPCDAGGCLARLEDGRHIAINTGLDQLAEDCRMADLVVTVEIPAARNAAHCSGIKLIRSSMTAGVTGLLYLNGQTKMRLIPVPSRPWTVFRPVR